MLKRLLLLTLSLLLMLMSFLNVSWELSVKNRRIPGRFSSSQIRLCREAAQRAAEELLETPARLPPLERSCRLSFAPPSGSDSLLTHSLLTATEGIVTAQGVFVNSRQLGTVADGEELEQALRSFILNQMPNSAALGFIKGRLDILPVYSAEGHETPCGDMVLLISGAAPVFYMDSQGEAA